MINVKYYSKVIHVYHEGTIIITYYKIINLIVFSKPHIIAKNDKSILTNVPSQQDFSDASNPHTFAMFDYI